MNIVYKKLEELKVYENNAKIHTEEQIEQIKKSIENVGFLDPIGIDEDGMIIEGHGRYYAAQKLNMEEVPCVELFGLDDSQKKAYILAHNKLTMNTGYDFEKLKGELESLKELNFEDFDFTGFTEDEILTYTEDINLDDILTSEFKTKTKHKKKHICPKCNHEWEE